MSATRPWVDAFADEMERKLALNRHKGDATGWQSETPAWLLARLIREVAELAHGVESGDDVVSEAADVANYAMMIADVAGGLMPKASAAPEERT